MKMFSKRRTKTPVLSVVIPAYNEEHCIGRCLEALATQDGDVSFEVIVCDNNSTDQTARIARSYHATVVTERRKGYAFTVNTGVLASHARLTLVTDADCIVPSTWVRSYYHYFRKYPKKLAASGPFVYNDESLLMKMITTILYHSYSRLLVRSTIGVNMAFRREAFESVGGFDTRIHLQADSYFGLRVARCGPIGFVHGPPVIASGRRFTSFFPTIREGLVRGINFLTLKYLDRPVAIDFRDIRSTGS